MADTQDVWKAVELYAKLRRMAENAGAAENEKRVALRKIAEMEGTFPRIRDTYALYLAYTSGEPAPESRTAPTAAAAAQTRASILEQISDIAGSWVVNARPHLEALERLMSTFRNLNDIFGGSDHARDDDDEDVDEAEEDEEEDEEDGEEILAGIDLGELDWAAEDWASIEELDFAAKRPRFEATPSGNIDLGDILKVPAIAIPAGMLVEMSTDAEGALAFVQWILDNADESFK